MLVIISSVSISDVCSSERKIAIKTYRGGLTYNENRDLYDKDVPWSACIFASTHKVWLNFGSLVVIFLSSFFNCCCADRPDGAQQQQGQKNTGERLEVNELQAKSRKEVPVI